MAPMSVDDARRAPGCRRRNAIVPGFKVAAARVALPDHDADLPSQSSSVSATATMRPVHSFDRKVEDMKPSKSYSDFVQALDEAIAKDKLRRRFCVTGNLPADKSRRSEINWVIMDYLVCEGYPAAAENFARESNIGGPADFESIRERVQIRKAIHAGQVDQAIELINELDPEILDTNHLLHFSLLQLQLIEIIRTVLFKPGVNLQSNDFRPALEFATEQLSPRAPTDPNYQQALERTMALMIFPVEKMAPEFKELLNTNLREKVNNSVNKAILESRGQRSEAKIRQLVRARAWAEAQAREAKVDVPPYLPVGLDGPVEYTTQPGGDAVMT